MQEQFLKIIRDVVPDISEMDLGISISETGIDSIDLTVIWVALEKKFDHVIEDNAWFQLNTLNEVLHYFLSNASQLKTKTSSRPIELLKEIHIGMPQMANHALSESWLLKELGDMHWNLISKGIETPSALWNDEDGNRLYATFTRIAYHCTALHHFKENHLIHLKGSIKRFGTSIYLSSIDSIADGCFINAELMTQFSIRAGDNSSIEKRKPGNKINHIEELLSTPVFLNTYRLLRKDFLKAWRYKGYRIAIKHYPVHTQSYIINPYCDINGAGLLYFAAYPIIADVAMCGLFKSVLGNNDWIDNYQTICRDIYYFANCNASETIIADLHNFKLIDDRIITMVSLSRESDKVILAKIFTVRKLKNLKPI